jgi:hypothetical protein
MVTAAIQYYGSRLGRAVGTTWALTGTDGRDLVEHFYQETFSSEEPGVLYYERIAMALLNAVKTLRRKNEVSLVWDHWGSFAH